MSGRFLLSKMGIGARFEKFILLFYFPKFRKNNLLTGK